MTSFSSLINRLSVVKQIPIFSKLNWFELRKIALKSTLTEYKKGDLICQQGEPADFFYCLIHGRIQAYGTGPDGKQENLELIHRGKHFGIISLLTGENHSFNFEAINDSVVLKIAKNDFNEILKSIPQLGVEFSHSLSQRIRRSTAKTKSVFESNIISIYSPTKGSGSSTYAINLAISLKRETDKKVIFVDINSKMNTDHSSVSTVTEASPKWKKTPIDLNDIVGDDERMRASITKGDLKIDLLNVVFDPNDSTLVKQISVFVTTLAQDYHYVVVDLPNEMEDVVLKTLTESDLVQLITLDGKEHFAIAKQVIRDIKEALRENFKTEKLQVLISGLEAQCYLTFEDVNRMIDYDVYAKLPHIERSSLKEAVVSDSMTVITSDPDSEYGKIVTRIARRIGGVLIGLVLGGGAALGVAHIGVLRVLEEERIPIDIVVGSSMGALLGSFWAIGRSIDELEALAREFEKPRGLLKLVDPVIPVSGLVGGRAIKLWLRKTLGTKTFYSTEIPLKIVAYDLRRREELILDSGSLLDAVRRSVSIPGVVEPVRDKNRVIIDGGVLNPLPTNVLTGMGIKKIIAVNVLQSPEQVSEGNDIEIKQLQEQSQISFFTSPFKYIGIKTGTLFKRIFNPNISDIIVQSLQASEYLLAEQSAQQADVLIHPDTTGIHWFELYRVDDLIKAGELATRKAMPEIKKLVSEHRV